MALRIPLAFIVGLLIYMIAMAMTVYDGGWFVLLLSFAGLACFHASWQPSLRVRVLDPETNMTVESFHPTLSITGWLLAMFGVLFCPAIGVRGDRRWI